MSLARILYKLKKTNAYRYPANSFHKQVTELSVALSGLDQQMRPLNPTDVQNIIRKIDEDEKKIAWWQIKLKHCYKAAKEELQSYLRFPFEKFVTKLEIGNRYNIPNIFFEKPLKEKLIQLKKDWIEKNYKNKHLAKEIIESLDSIIQDYPLQTKE